jgi:peptide/nickel transport system permease protein
VSQAPSSLVLPGQIRWVPARLGWLGGPLRFIRQKPLGAFGALILIALVGAAAFAPQLATHRPTQTNLRAAREAPSPRHWLGTDQQGRDQWSRIVYGARISLRVALLSVLAGTVGGALLGIVSAYLGGKFDLLVQRLIDMLQAFPTLLLAMLIVSVLGATINNLIIAIAIVLIPNSNRVIRATTLSIKETPFIEAARVVGAADSRVILRHILPNVIPPILILVSIAIGSTIITEASLSYLGLGAQPPTPSWGNMLQEAQGQLDRAPWLAIFPGIAISLVVFGANMFGDALRDVLDPRLRGSR